MELDKRIKEGKRPLTCFDTDKAKEYLNKECYFSDYMHDFVDVERYCRVGRLFDINDNVELPFKTVGELYFEFCLPCEWVKPEEPEKKYRAFSLNEFSELYAIGDVVTFRLKDCEVIEQSMLIGFQSSDDEDIPGNGYVLIGNCRYGFMELFNNYELKYLDHWQPFGVMEE